MVGGSHPFLDYNNQHKMFILYKQIWENIIVDHYYYPNIIIGVLEKIWVNYIHFYAQLKIIFHNWIY